MGVRLDRWNKMQFFLAAVVLILLYECSKRMEKKLDGNNTRMLRAVLNKFWRQHHTKQQQYGHLPPITKTKLDEPDMQDTAGEVRTNTYAIYSCGPLHMDEQGEDVQLEPIYNSSLPMRYVAWERWTIEKVGERGSGRSMLPAWHDDYDEINTSSYQNDPNEAFALQYIQNHNSTDLTRFEFFALSSDWHTIILKSSYWCFQREFQVLHTDSKFELSHGAVFVSDSVQLTLVFCTVDKG